MAQCTAPGAGGCYSPIWHGAATRSSPSISLVLAPTANDWAASVATAARAGPGPALLVGHSPGGTAIAQGAELAAEHVLGLIFVAGVMVRDGETMDSACPEIRALAQTVAERHPGAPAAVAIDLFYRHRPPDVAAAAIARLRPQPEAVAATPLRLTAARFGRLPRAYVECGDDAVVPLAVQRRMQAALPCNPVVTIESDHSPFLSRPAELATHIDAIARRFESGR